MPDATTEAAAVPAMTHELSRSWDQPGREEILIDDVHAVMTKKTFDMLHDYSCSMPSGVYEGKMWKARPHAFFPAQPDGWYLRWYGPSSEPGYVSNNERLIIIITPAGTGTEVGP